VGYISEMSMEMYVQLLSHVAWNAPCAEGARARQ
jgi:hypothetical protein